MQILIVKIILFLLLSLYSFFVIFFIPLKNLIYFLNFKILFFDIKLFCKNLSSFSIIFVLSLISFLKLLFSELYFSITCLITEICINSEITFVFFLSILNSIVY